jgi:hypothetical protein
MVVATRHSALIAAVGVVLGFAGPLHAASSADDAAAHASSQTSAIPPSVANANAQLRSSDTPAAAADAQPAAAAEPTPDAQPAAANPMVAAAEAEAPAAREAAPPPSASEHSIWDETSLIGKIFIGFGALLTIASAARMFMA